MSSQKPSDISSTLVKESTVDGVKTIQQQGENVSVTVSGDGPKGAKPVVVTTEKRLLSNGNGVVANGC